MTRLFAEGLRGTGGRNVLPETVPADGRDTDARVRAMIARSPGAVVYGGGPDGMARFARALAETGYRGPRIASQTAHDPGFPARAGEAAEGWLVVSTATAPSAAPSTRAFTRAFRTRHRADPPSFAAEAYDVVRLVTSCVRTLDRPRPTRHDLVPVLRRTTYKGVSKSYAFEPENGGYVGEGVFFYRVTGGRFRFLGSDPRKV